MSLPLLRIVHRVSDVKTENRCVLVGMEINWVLSSLGVLTFLSFLAVVAF